MSNQIVKQETRQVSFPSNMEWQQIIDIGTRAFRSGLLPQGIKTAEAAGILALKAWELGLPPMMAFSHIHIINGKPTLSAELMQALVRKNLPGIQISILENTEKKATIKILRTERGSLPVTFTFPIEDAERAKLLSKDVWKQYPKAMLFSRCMSAILREVCPDALLGVSYTAEELGADVTPDGNVIETTGKMIEPKKEDEKLEEQPEWRIALMAQVKAKREQYNLTPDELLLICQQKFNKTPKTMSEPEFTDLFLYLDTMFSPKTEHPDLTQPAPWEADAANDPRNVK